MRLPAGVALVALIAALWALPAMAQENPEPFRFLRPALEGEGTGPAADRAPEETPPAAADEPAAVDNSAAAEEGASAPAEPAAASTLPEAEADGADEAAQPAGEMAAEPLESTTPPAPDDLGSIEPAPPAEESGSFTSLPRHTEPLEGPLRFGITASRDLGRMMRILAPITAGLEEAIGRPVEFLPMATYGAMIDAQVAHRIDGGFYSAAAFAFAEARCGCLDPLVAPAAADGNVAYYAVIVVRRGAPVRSPRDLAGRSIAAGPDDSLGARRMQLAGLAKEGVLEPDDPGEIRDAGSAREALLLLLAGEVDAAFAWSSLAGDETAGYSRGTFTDLVAHGELDMDDIRIVWRSPPITHGPFAVTQGFPADIRQAMEDFFLGLRDSEPIAYDTLNKLYGGGYRAVGRQDYEGLAVLAGEGGTEGAP